MANDQDIYAALSNFLANAVNTNSGSTTWNPTGNVTPQTNGEIHFDESRFNMPVSNGPVTWNPTGNVTPQTNGEIHFDESRFNMPVPQAQSPMQMYSSSFLDNVSNGRWDALSEGERYELLKNKETQNAIRSARENIYDNEAANLSDLYSADFLNSLFGQQQQQNENTAGNKMLSYSNVNFTDLNPESQKKVAEERFGKDVGRLNYDYRGSSWYK